MRILLLLVLFSLSTAVIAQTKDYFIVDGKDTTYVKKVYFNTQSNGYLNKVVYTDLNGKQVELKGKSIPKITTFYTGGASIDRVPLHADDPEGYVRYLGREADGEILCWVKEPSFGPTSTTYTTHGPGGTKSSATTTSSGQYGKYYFNIYLGGKYYDIKKRSDYEEILLPKLQSCPAISQQLQSFKMPKQLSAYTPDEQGQLIELIRAFNKSCGK